MRELIKSLVKAVFFNTVGFLTSVLLNVPIALAIWGLMGHYTLQAFGIILAVLALVMLVAAKN